MEYDKYVLKILRRKELMEENGEVRFLSGDSESSNGGGAAIHPVNFKWFEESPKCTVKRMMCSRKSKCLGIRKRATELGLLLV